MATDFEIRKERFYSELQYIYSELYYGKDEEFQKLLQLMKDEHKKRTPALKRKDHEALCNMNWFRASSRQDRLIHGKEQYGKLVLQDSFEQPENFYAAAAKLLFLANKGAELIEIDGIGDLFCIPGTQWQNKTKVHITLRILRIICEIVCPAVLLYGSFVGFTDNYTAYFGTPEKPELHLMSDAAMLATVWHTVATHDTRVLVDYINQHAHLPENRVFYRTRTEETGVFWDLDYSYLQILKMDEESHKKFLQSWYTGAFKESLAHAHRVKKRSDGSWGVRGTIEEMTGGDKRVEQLVEAFFVMLSGIPVPKDPKSVSKLLKIRKELHVFDNGADIWTPGTENNAAIGMGRYKDGQKFFGLYNFSAEEQIFSLHDPGLYKNLLTGADVKIVNLVRMKPYSYAWLLAK